MVERAIIVGAFHEIIELAEETGIQIFGLIDNEKKGEYRNYPIIGNDINAINLSSDCKLIPLIITPDLPSTRKSLSLLYKNLGFIFLTLISKNAKISKTAKIGNGTIIQSGVNISSEVKIGKFVKLNTACNVMHNAIIGDFTTIAPNSVILGNVEIGKSCYIGSHATILPNLTISEKVIIGAGAVVTKSISIPGKYVGIPAIKM